MNLHKLFILLLAFFVSLVITGCFDDNNSETKTATLSVLLTDAPSDYEAVYVTIDKVILHKADDEISDEDNNESVDENISASTDLDDWITVATPNETFDLLTLQNGVTDLLGENNISTGKYTQMRLVLGSQEDNSTNISGNPHPYANYVIFNDGSDPKELDVPSNTIKTNHNFTLTEDGATMLIDFDANRSIHEAADRLILRPVVSIQTQRNND